MRQIYSTLSLSRNIFQSLFFILLGSIIFGCTTTKTQKPVTIKEQITDRWLVNKAILEKIQHFETSGKVKFTSTDQNISASFRWQQNTNDLSLRLTSFLGITLLKLESTPTATTIIDHKGKRYYGKDMSALIQSLTGVDLPIAELTNWLKALPNKANAYQLNNQNTLAYLSQYPSPNQKAGWQVTYHSYGTFNDISLPRHINMSNQDQQVELLITRWNL